jgi:hypothetical protein
MFPERSDFLQIERFGIPSGEPLSPSDDIPESALCLRYPNQRGPGEPRADQRLFLGCLFALANAKAVAGKVSQAVGAVLNALECAMPYGAVGSYAPVGGTSPR